MKVSMNWLKELVDVDVDVSELSRLFNLHSAEVEEYYQLVDASHLVVGHVVSKEKHPDADKLSVCQVDIGGEISQIVCGAPNVDAGQNVIVSLPGAVLPGGFKIKKSVIRDVESNGMICSLGELGLDKKFHNEEGIHVIGVECKPGDNALQVLALDDQVMALDLTPNRADLLSVLGVAYDSGAILNKKVKPREISVLETEQWNDCVIELETEYCSGYYARVIENIEIKESPKWMQSRLIAAGMRPISNVVDITNYVMLETGQPLHAFDYDLLETGKIVVRQAHDEEELITLDNQKRLLTKDDIVITNGKKAVALGGVMGGLDTEITANSKRILLESAVFDPYHIRKTSNRLDLRSEASMRFERKVDPNRVVLALEMATDLFHKYASGNVLKGISKVDHMNHEPKEIKVRIDKINQVLGSNFDESEISETLQKLDFPFDVINGLYTIQAPTRRQDIETYQDIVEEIGRIIGYDRLPTTLPSTVSQGKLNEFQVFKRNVQTILTGLGLNETITYSLVDEKKVFEFTKEESELVYLLMPLSSEKNVLCKTPLNGLIEAVQYNTARKNTDLALFEIGKNYHPKQETILLSGALTGLLSSTLWQGKKEVVDFYVVKGILQSLFNEIGLSHLEFVVNSDYPNLHPGQSAYIKDRSGVIGFVGKVHPEYAKNNDLKDVYVFEIELEKAFELRRTFKKVKEINKNQSMYRDLAIVLDKTVPSSQVVEVITKAGKRLLSDVSIFDLYVGENVEKHQKSLALRLEFNDTTKPVESKEVEERIQAILQALDSELNAKLR